VPELPEVETVRLGLVRQLQNFTIARVEVCRDSSIASPAEPSLFCQGLEGCVVQDWRRRGKYLLASLIRGTETGHWVVHLG
jgi:formamidopyrimidine-DNA glycosylase